MRSQLMLVMSVTCREAAAQTAAVTSMLCSCATGWLMFSSTHRLHTLPEHQSLHLCLSCIIVTCAQLVVDLAQVCQRCIFVRSKAPPVVVVQHLHTLTKVMLFAAMGAACAQRCDDFHRLTSKARWRTDDMLQTHGSCMPCSANM